MALALCLPQFVQGAEVDGGLDRAMQAFVNAINNKNATGILAAFSITTPWQYVMYDVTDQANPPSRTPMTYTQMQQQFRAKKGFLYGDFFNDFEGTQMLRDNIIYMGKGIKKGTTFTPGDMTLGRFYITWRQEGNRWVIAEIGQTAS